MANDDLRDRDLVLPPNTFAYILDSTKGKVSVYVGPYKNSLSNTDTLVVWDTQRSRFVPVNDVERATQVFQMAGEGQYIVLSNPAAPDKVHPPRGMSTEATDLEVGRQVNIAGPDSFPLWPGQIAKTIDGHHLRHNQYLVVRVYDAAAARQNWTSAVVTPQAGAEGVVDQTTDFTTGQLIVVNGTDVSFFIPPTGIEVVPDSNRSFVREAVTLERLEYCILLDENGDKRYVQGPNVVFPRPTEQFVTRDDGSRKFRAIELNDHSGVYVKVIAEYTDDDGTEHRVGEELFITGREEPVYFPRPEHGIIRYGGSKQVHYAIAIPEGEGRYVLNRDTGEVKLVRGPSMFLPDPRHEVVVLRILDTKSCELFYPGNTQAVEVNQTRAAEAMDFDDSQRQRRLRGAAPTSAFAMAAGTASPMDDLLGAGAPEAGDVLQRGTTYSRPRSIVLDTKYEGAVTINIWPGYAVLVTNKADERRVERGPKTVMLEYDETILPLELSTGRPKDDRVLLRTAYLRTINNQVSDRIVVETKDLVRVEIDVSYRVNFEGETPEEQQKWFALENYIKVLADHCRSRLRNVAKQHGILDFYTQTIDIIRTALLGAPVDGVRTGLVFDANNMRLFDVEVLNVSIEDPKVASLLTGAQSDALTGAIQLSKAEDTTLRNRRLQELHRADLAETDRTAVTSAEIAMAAITRAVERTAAEIEGDRQATVERNRVRELELEQQQQTAVATASMEAVRQQPRLDALALETTEYVRRMGAVSEDFIAALQQFGGQDFVQRIVMALGPIAASTGVTTADVFKQLFQDTPFEGAFEALAVRPLAYLGGGDSQP